MDHIERHGPQLTLQQHGCLSGLRLTAAVRHSCNAPMPGAQRHAAPARFPADTAPFLLPYQPATAGTRITLTTPVYALSDSEQFAFACYRAAAHTPAALYPVDSWPRPVSVAAAGSG